MQQTKQTTEPAESQAKKDEPLQAARTNAGAEHERQSARSAARRDATPTSTAIPSLCVCARVHGMRAGDGARSRAVLEREASSATGVEGPRVRCSTAVDGTGLAGLD